jgi:tRNA-specific 2-thiouridylase
VAAALLQEAGHEVIGCFMRLGSPGEAIDEPVRADDVCRAPVGGAGHDQAPGARDAGHPGDAASDAPARPSGAPRAIPLPTVPLRIGHQGCCSINDAADARLVAARLGVPFYVLNFKRDFGRIMDYFVGEYNAGRTPNPCVRCNDWLKFGRLHEHALQLGADFVASGHYARVERDARGVPALRRGVDHAKDQSYVLFGIGRATLARTLLPIGGLRKQEVRARARALGLPVSDKPDSQEICFVPDNDYAGMVARRAPDAVRPGAVLDLEGNVIGEHPGHQHFTIGQRKGVGLALGQPMYVVRKDAVANTVTLGPREALLAAGCVATEGNWLVEPHMEWRPCHAKIRSNAAPVAARVRAEESEAGAGVDRGSIEVRFDEPQPAVAPGQAVVCYDDDRVVCGGWIDRAVA